jgi:hypothetical protein
LRRERLPMLAELVEVVIGVDTHKHTHEPPTCMGVAGREG